MKFYTTDIDYIKYLHSFDSEVYFNKQRYDYENKAYIVGMLHDIGRRVGIVNIPKHVYEGYKYAMDKGWDEVARVCMTHSYPLMQEELQYDPTTEEEMAIKNYIANCQADDYDKLIQICDALATDYGFVILEKRFILFLIL